MKWDHLMESMDRELRAAAKAYAVEQSDENAHRLAQAYLRSTGTRSTPSRTRKKIRNPGRNQTEITFSDGTVVLLSYGVPVVANLATGGFVKTKTKHSVTTTKHINKWLEGRKAKEVDQSFLDELI